MRASDEEWRAEIESAMSTAVDMKRSAEEEIKRGKVMRATASQKIEALEFGADAVLAEKIIYQPKKKENSEGLAFGPNAPQSKRERKDIAARVRPAFDMVVSFAKRLASVQSQREDFELREKALAKRERRLEEHGEALREREDQGDIAQAHLGWRSRVLAKTTRSLRDFVPRQLHFVIDALDRGEDPVPTKGPEAFPDAWSIPAKPGRKKVQEKLDGISNDSLVRCFAATQDAYLLCEEDPQLQKTFGTGIKMLAHEAAMRGVDIETGKHDPEKAINPERARLHVDAPHEPIRVKRRVRERQLVR